MRPVQRLHSIGVAGLLVALAACDPRASGPPSSTAPTSGNPTVAASAVASAAATTTPSAAPTSSVQGVALEPAASNVGTPGFSDLVATPGGFMALEMYGDGALAAGTTDGASWTRLDAAAAFGSPIVDLVAGPSGWVAAQETDPSTSGRIGTVLWFSADGRSWERLPDHARLSAGNPEALAVGPWGYALAGSTLDASESSVATIWVSPDGRGWHMLPVLRDHNVVDVVVTTSGVVVVNPDVGRLVLAIDGVAWSAPVDDERLASALVEVAPDGETLLVVTGGADSVAVRTIEIRRAPAGLTLDWGATAGDFSGSGATTLATGARGAIVVGFDAASLRPRIWSSEDGRAWDRTTLDAQAFGGGVPAVAAVGSEAFVVLGWDGVMGGELVFRPWTSADGASWSQRDAEALGMRVPPPPPSCPAQPPTDVAGLVAMLSEDAPAPAAVFPACFGGAPLSVEGWIAGCGGCGGIVTMAGRPPWLMNPMGYAAFWLVADPDPEQGGGRIGMYIDPARAVAVPDFDTQVRVRGHFKDPAASTCRLVPLPGWFAAVPPVASTVARCEQLFVADEIELLDAP